jgi:hypothetical protein
VVHHQSYKRLGGEYLRDLVVLCRDCHSQVHQREKERGEGLGTATKIYIHETWLAYLSRPDGIGKASKRYRRRLRLRHAGILKRARQ